jgi:enoyl-CoA hydratase
MSDAHEVKITLESGVLAVTLNCPARMNAMTPQMLAALEGVFTTRAWDSDVRAVVLTGSGRAFCAGADLDNHELLSGRESERLMEVTNNVIRGIISCPKPVIAAVNGPAAGFGVALALAADLTVASTSAYFLLAFTKVGLMPDGGSTALIAASIGRARAMRMSLLAERIPAADAATLGLIAEVVDDASFADRIAALGAALVAGPATALRKTKEAVNAAALTELEAGFRRECEGQVELLGSEEFAAAASAFVQKTKG